MRGGVRGSERRGKRGEGGGVRGGRGGVRGGVMPRLTILLVAQFL